MIIIILILFNDSMKFVKQYSICVRVSDFGIFNFSNENQWNFKNLFSLLFLQFDQRTVAVFRQWF